MRRGGEIDQTVSGDAAGESGLTRAQLLARGGVAGLAVLGWERGLFGGAEPAFGASTALRLPFARSSPAPTSGPRRLTIRHPARDAGDGYLFIAPTSGPGQRGVLIFDNHGEPVWFRPVTPVSATAFRASTLRGKPVLTWWEGTYSNEGPRARRVRDRGLLVSGGGTGQGRRLPGRRPARVPAHGRGDGARDEERGCPARPHGLRRRPERAALQRCRPGDRDPERPRPLRVGQPRPRRGRGVARAPNKNHFDYFHINSIDVDADGHLLVSARNTWTVYKVHRRTGEVHLAARRPQERLRDGTGDRDGVAARRALARRRPADQHLRQRRRAAGADAVARDPRPARHAANAGDARTCLQAPSQPARRQVHGQRPGAAGRRRRRRAGGASRS